VEGGPSAGRRRLLVLGAGAAQLGLLAAAHDRGLHVIAVDRDPAAPGFRYADRRAIISAEDEPGIDRLAAAERIDGIIAPGIDFPVAIAARVAERLALPHPIRPETAVTATSKVRQRERFAEAGVARARFQLCATLPEAEAAAESFGYPCVVKAPDRQGQKGLTLVREPDELAEAFRTASAAARNNLALVEELIDGLEVTVNGFSVGGRFHPLTVTDRVVAKPPAFGVALAHVFPCSLDERARGEVVALAERAAAAVGIENGPSYTQVLVGPDGPRVGELAARLGGGHDAELCEAALGIDLNGLALATALGEPVEASALERRETAGGACIRFLVPPVGALRAIQGVDAAEAVRGVEWVLVYREPGAIFAPLRRGADRAGAVLAVGSDREQAVARAERAAATIRFETVATEALV
jgi:biotin carboxylase